MNPVKTYYMSKEELAAKYGLVKKPKAKKVSDKELDKVLNSFKPKPQPQPKLLQTYDLKLIRRICDKTAELYFKGMGYHEAFAMAKKIEGWK